MGRWNASQAQSYGPNAGAGRKRRRGQRDDECPSAKAVKGDRRYSCGDADKAGVVKRGCRSVPLDGTPQL